MPYAALALEIFIYSLALWLGLFLLARDIRKPHLRLVGLGLVAYALALAAGALLHFATPITAEALAQVRWFLVYLPALFWSGALFQILPQEHPSRHVLIRIWTNLLQPITVLVLFWGAAIQALTPTLTTLTILQAALVLLPLVVAFSLLTRTLRAVNPKPPLALPLVATLMFALGIGLLLFPLGWLPTFWVVLAIGGDLLLLGFGIAILDAFEEGERLRAEVWRSSQASVFTALLFGSQVLIVIYLATGLTVPMLALLMAVIAGAVTLQTFATPLGALLDHITFRHAPHLAQQRAALRATAGSLARLDPNLQVDRLPEGEFVQLTRRALSHFGDLPRLASSPLTRLPLIDTRLQARAARDDTLARAHELKTLLAESIARLKPQDQGDFGTSDAWRFYNALHFPYVVGLKPYRRNQTLQHLAPHETQALQWFRSQVPERTLHNWQNAAAKLVAQDLREQFTSPDNL